MPRAALMLAVVIIGVVIILISQHRDAPEVASLPPERREAFLRGAEDDTYTKVMKWVGIGFCIAGGAGFALMVSLSIYRWRQDRRVEADAGDGESPGDDQR